jgi:MFS family permease
MCGIGSGGFFALQSAIISQILGSHRVNAGISWLEVGGSFGYLAGPVSAGALLDAFGGADQGAKPYRPAMVCETPLSFPAIYI